MRTFCSVVVVAVLVVVFFSVLSSGCEEYVGGEQASI